MSFFSYCRIVGIEKSKDRVEVRVKKWWRWERPVRIPFRRIEYFDVSYPERPNHDTEIYDLYLLAKGPWYKVHLWRFGDLKARGPIHREMARGCANLIVKLTNIRYGPPDTRYEMPLSDFRDKYVCAACGHRVHPDSEAPVCLYCGGKDIRTE